MTKTVYKVDLDLSTTKLEEIYPGRAYVRHGGRKERVIHHKDGTISTASSIIWTEEEVTQVWMECVENSDEVEVRKAFLLHLSMAGGVLNINLTAFMPDDALNVIGLQKVGMCELFCVLFVVYECVSILKNMLLCGLPVPAKIRELLTAFLDNMTAEMPDANH